MSVSITTIRYQVSHTSKSIPGCHAAPTSTRSLQSFQEVEPHVTDLFFYPSLFIQANSNTVFQFYNFLLFLVNLNHKIGTYCGNVQAAYQKYTPRFLGGSAGASNRQWAYCPSMTPHKILFSFLSTLDQSVFQSLSLALSLSAFSFPSFKPREIT